MDILGNEKLQKSCNNYCCQICDYNTSRKSSYDKHLLTAKHIKLANGNNVETVSCGKLQKKCKIICNICDKEFQNRSGLWKHNKKCHEDQCDNTNTEPIIETGNKDELIKYLLKENNDFKNIVMEVIKNGTHNTNTNTTTNSHNNNNNKTFNLQFFLNETCKDAMNLMDFVQDIVLTLNDLEETGRIGFAEGISKMINKRLKALDITQRPIHCSDLKRETLYIKNENKWEKEEDDKPILTNAVKHIAGKNMLQIFDWQKAHPDYNDPETRTSDKYMKMLTNVMSGGTEEEIQENYEKIIKNIIKESGIVKENFLI